MKHFYLKKNENIEGPYDHGELVYLLSQGELHPEETIREGEQGIWGPAAQMLGISGQRQKASPSSTPKTQREITGLKRRPASELQSVSEVEATSHRSVPYKILFVTTFARADSGSCGFKETYKSQSPQRLGAFEVLIGRLKATATPICKANYVNSAVLQSVKVPQSPERDRPSNVNCVSAGYK